MSVAAKNSINRLQRKRKSKFNTPTVYIQSSTATFRTPGFNWGEPFSNIQTARLSRRHKRSTNILILLVYVRDPFLIISELYDPLFHNALLKSIFTYSLHINTAYFICLYGVDRPIIM